METRHCTKCEHDKPASEFFRRARSRSGFMSQCKVCHTAWQRDNADKRRVTRKKHRDKLRAEALAVLGGVCIRCGIADHRVLQIDHVDGGGGIERRKLGDQGINRKIVNGAEGYQLLCANCHAIKTWHEEA